MQRITLKIAPSLEDKSTFIIIIIIIIIIVYTPGSKDPRG